MTRNTVHASTSPLFSFVEQLTLISLLMPSSRSVIIILGTTSISVPTGVASLMFTIYGLLWKIGGLSLTSLIGITLLRDIVFGSVFATPSSEILLKKIMIQFSRLIIMLFLAFYLLEILCELHSLGELLA